MVPEAAVNKASSDHIRIAEKPINVALNFMCLPPASTKCQPPNLVAQTVTGPSAVGIRT
jgi:hypothetical protein